MTARKAAVTKPRNFSMRDASGGEYDVSFGPAGFRMRADISRLDLLARDASVLATLILGMGYSPGEVERELPHDPDGACVGPIGKALRVLGG